MGIGKNIKDYRLKNELTQTELADKIGIKKSILSLIENEKRNVTYKVLNALIEYSGKSEEFWTIDKDYTEERKKNTQIDNLLDMIVETEIIKNVDDIEADHFKDAIYKALKADLQHRLDKKSLEQLKK